MPFRVVMGTDVIEQLSWPRRAFRPGITLTLAVIAAAGRLSKEAETAGPA
jgi:hypothetical protein